MLNKEKFKEEIFEIACEGDSIAVSKDGEKVVRCTGFFCDDCMFGGEKCPESINKWANSEYVPYVDWSKVPVDTKILVSSDGRDWSKRYFSEFKNGNIFAWAYGATSFSTLDQRIWKNAKLYKEALTGEGSEKENGVAVTCEDKKNNSVKEDDKRIFEFTGKTTYNLNGDYVFMTKDREYYDVPDAIERLLPEETHEEDEFKITIEKL